MNLKKKSKQAPEKNRRQIEDNERYSECCNSSDTNKINFPGLE